MGRIGEIKKQVRHNEWAAMVQNCQTSGKKVEESCKENGINVSTYYKRLNVLRTELIEGSKNQSIVPASVSAAALRKNLCKFKNCDKNVMFGVA